MKETQFPQQIHDASTGTNPSEH